MLIKQVHQKCYICHHWYFLNYSFKFQPNVYNRCHDLLMMSMNLTALAVKSSEFCCIISLISKNEVIKLMHNANLAEKKGTLSSMKNYYHI